MNGEDRGAEMAVAVAVWSTVLVVYAVFIATLILAARGV